MNDNFKKYLDFLGMVIGDIIAIIIFYEITHADLAIIISSVALVKASKSLVFNRKT